jgi:two-component system LytT family response regulator
VARAGGDDVKILVVDDEPLARKRLVRMLGEIADVSISGEAGDAESALAKIRSGRPDLVLLDIRMPGVTGLELAASSDDLPAIVFTTAYDQYALDAFEVSAVDYLLKPIQRERLERAIDKARGRAGTLDASRIELLLSRLDRAPEPVRSHARSGTATRIFDAAEVTRIQASEKYAIFQHAGREYVLDESLNTLEERLGSLGFLRVHRSELVNLEAVRVVHSEDGATEVELSDGQRVPVSRRATITLKERLGIRGS